MTQTFCTTSIGTSPATRLATEDMAERVRVHAPELQSLVEIQGGHRFDQRSCHAAD